MRTIITSIIVTLLTSMMVIKLYTPQNTALTAEKETAFERIQRTRIIKCGYIFTSLLQRNENTKELSGPAFDITNAIADNLKLKIEWTAESSFANVSEDLKNNRFDMLCVPFAPNSARGQVMDMSRKIFFMPFYLWTKTGTTHDMHDLSWVNQSDTVLADVDGTTIRQFYNNSFPKAKISSLPELTPVSDILMHVATGKADAALFPLIDARVFIKNNPNTIQQASTKPVAVVSHTYFMPKGDFKLKGMVDTALNEIIENGALERILKTYNTDSVPILIPLAPEYQTTQ
jgi:ABC-type amino acid transport substrate-binding protein